MDKNVISLIKELNSLGCYLYLESDKLKLDAPKGTINDELREKIKLYKEQIIEYLYKTSKHSIIPKIEKKKTYPVSFAQRRLWILSQFKGGSEVYNIPSIYPLNDNIELPLLENAIHTIIGRHEILRTIFIKDALEDINQCILSPQELKFKIDYQDFSSNENGEDLFQDFVDSDSYQPFDLEKGPLFRASIIRVSQQKIYLYFNMHHIISDGWSMSILLEEVMTIYAGLKKGENIKLPPLSIQYKDYSVWQQDLLESGAYEAQKSFWKSELSGDLPRLDLPTSKIRPKIKTNDGELLNIYLTPDLTSRLLDFVKQQKGSLFSTLLTALNVLFYRYTNNNDVIIGTPVSGRAHKDLENQLGFYVNTLALRTKISSQESFSEINTRVKANSYRAFENQMYPFDLLVKELEIPVDASRSSVFDVLFTLQNISKSNQKVALEDIDKISNRYSKSKFDLEIMIEPLEEVLSINFIYNTELYDRGVIEGMLENFKTLLTSIIERPSLPISDLLFVSPKECELLSLFNNSKKEYPKNETVLDLFKENVLKSPNSIAVVFENSELTYKELDEVSSQLANYLIKEYIVEPKDFVGLKLYRNEWMLVSILAILKTGGAYVPVDPDYPVERIDFIKNDSGYKVCIDDNELEKFRGVQSSYEVNTLIKLSLSDPAYVIYTSGSTGIPKGVVNHHEGIHNRLLWKKEYLGVSPSDVILQKTPFTFDVSVWEFLLPLISGCKLIFAKPEGHKDPFYLQELITEQNITILHFVPSMLGIFLNNLKTECRSISHIVCSGEALSENIVHTFISKFSNARIHNLYGPTEAAIDVTAIDLTAVDIEKDGVTIGYPVANTHIYIVDDKGQQLPIGVPGELWIGGIQVSDGYLNRPELNDENFIESPFSESEKIYKTGDEAMWLANGTIKYVGRKDNQVKIRGQRIELGEIEYQLKQKEGINEIVVLVKELRDEQQLIAFLVSDQEETSSTIQKFLSSKLPTYMIPSRYYQLDELPLTANGKINRKELLTDDENELSLGNKYVPARNTIDEKVIFVWEKELQKDQIGIQDNFFALGGDSIKAINIALKINTALETKINVSDMYLHQTIKELVDYIKEGNFTSAEIEFSYGYQQIERIHREIEKENESKSILPENYESIYPLVPIEEGMIYSSLLRSEEPVYYDRFIYMVQIDDVEALKSAMEQMVKRHSILRTKYHMEDFSRPVKVVWNHVDIPMTFLDLSNKTTEEQLDALNHIREEDLQKRFTFNDELLYNFKFVKLNNNQYYVIWNFHHSILDGWSIAVFTQELTVLLSKEKVTELPKLQYSYKDYCAGVLGTNVSNDSREYWQNLLTGYSRNKLPFNFRRTKISDELGMRIIECRVDDVTLKGLEELGKKMEVSLKTIFLAAHTFLMHIICSEEEVVTGVVSHDRPELEQSDKILGCFLNTIPIRVNFAEIKDTSELIKHVNKYLIDTKKHEVHISDIAGFIGEKTSLENPIFDTLLNYTHFHVLDQVEKNSNIKGVDSKLHGGILAPDEMTNTLFDVEVGLKTYGLNLRVKYTPSFFTERDASETLEMYIKILNKFLELPKLETEMVINEDDYKELIYDYNDTIIEEDRNISMHKLFEEQSIKTPNNIALVDGEKTLTYQELNQRANDMANYLIEKGGVQETNIGLLCDRSFDMIIGLFGILKAGGSYVPIDPEYPLQRQKYIVDNSKVDIVVTNYSSGLETKMPEKEFIEITDIKKRQSNKNPDIRITGNQLAYTIYTSGSTGNPKGVMIDHYSAVNLIRWVNDTFSINEKDRLLFITSVCFDLSVYDIFGILASGGSLVIAKKEDVQDFDVLKELLINERITFWDSVPTTFNYLIDELEEEGLNSLLPDLRLVFMSGDWIPVQLPDRAKHFFPNAEIISLGGATEGTVWSNYYPINKVEDSWSSIPYGKPIRNNFFYILDDNLKPVPKGIVGELFIGGIGVAKGYDNDFKKTEAAFMKDPFNESLGGMMYRTGDLGRWLWNGNMEFIGRKDNQVKIRGFRVELGEIESVLSKHTFIKEAIVHAFLDKNNQNQLCAYLVTNTSYKRSELKSYLKDRLPEYMVPGFFIILEELPLNSNGKIDRKALPLPQQDLKEDKVFINPETEIQKKIAEVWKGVLKIDQIGIQDDFFELGANSLSVASFVARFHKNTGYSIGVRDVFHNPTIEDLERLLKEVEKESFRDIHKAEFRESYPLSDAQRRLWIISQFQEASIAYNIPSIASLDNVNDIQKLKSSINAVIKRHEILRTVFRKNKDEEVRQWILPFDELNFEIDYIDIRNEEHKEQLIEKYANKQSAKPFDLEQWPLMRAGILEVSDEKYILCYNIHHIISDGWSTQVLINDVLRFYKANGMANYESVEKLQIQYKDYTVWQQSRMENTKLNTHKKYWLSQLQGELPILELPTSRYRPAIKTYNGHALETAISEDTATMLKEFSIANGGTLFMGLLTSIKTLLYLYTLQEDIIIGTPVAGREHQNLEDQIGFYVNVLPLRNQIHKEKTFKELFEEIKRNTIESYSHQEYPFDRLVEELPIKRDTSRGAIFDVMLVLQNENQDSLTTNLLNGTIFEVKDVGKKTSKFDLLFNISEKGNGLSFILEYNTDVYDKGLIEQFIVHYKLLLEELLKNPERKIRQINYLSKKEETLLLENFMGKTLEIENINIVELFEKQASVNPDKIALISENTEKSYKEVNEYANRLAHYLKDVHSINATDLVGINLSKSEQCVMVILAVLKTGSAYVPLDNDYPKERIEYIISDSKCKMCITEGVLHNFAEVSEHYKKENSSESIDNDQIAYVIYTSGSTGKPKGVLISHGSLAEHIISKTKTFEIKDDDKFILFSSISFDASIEQIFLPLVNGAALYIPKKETLTSSEKLATVLHNQKITHLHSVPSFLETLNDGQPNFLRRIVSGGETISSDFVAKWYGKVAIYNQYGPTECTISSHVHLIQNPNQLKYSIGKALHNTKCYILNEDLNPQPIGVIGELYIGGNRLSTGYLNNPVLTNKKFIDNPFEEGEKIYRTGDLGKWLPNGEIELSGRIDNQIKIRGYRVDLEEVGSVLREVNGLEKGVVVHKKIGNSFELIAYLILKKGQEKSKLKHELRKQLPDFMIPNIIMIVESFPLTPNGKIDRSKLPVPERSDLLSTEHVAPRNEIEHKLKVIWENILNKKDVGVFDNFFDLGGHSIKAVKIISEIQRQFSITVDISNFFREPNIAELAIEIENYFWQDNEIEEEKVADRIVL